MAVLNRLPERVMRASFPGEIDISLGNFESIDGMSVPSSFGIELQYVRHHDKLRRISPSVTSSGEWTLCAAGFQPAYLTIQSWSLIGGLTKTYLDEQYPGLVAIVGEEVARELMRHMRGMLRDFVPVTYDEAEIQYRYLRFNDLELYVDWMLGMWERFTAYPGRPFDPQRARNVLFTKPWRSRKWGPPVQLEYLDTHRSDVPEGKVETLDKSIAAFRRLAEDAQAVLAS